MQDLEQTLSEAVEWLGGGHLDIIQRSVIRDACIEAKAVIAELRRIVRTGQPTVSVPEVVVIGHASRVAPIGYVKLPDGVLCKCPRMFGDGQGNHYCCRAAE